MNSKYRKKPVVIDAVQFNIANANSLIGGRVFQTTFDKLVIETLEGEMTATAGDWIIKGVAGEFYPCKDDIFQKSYEPA